MSGSGHIINYNIRVAKSVERRMIIDVAKDLFREFDPMASRYIGFGSFYFTDYKLVHRDLHINNLVSFEMEMDDVPRAEFNKPYKSIKVIPGASSVLLPHVDWTKQFHDFVWMDYDGELSTYMFADCETIFSFASAGSIYLMTCKRQLNKLGNLENFKETFGNLVPHSISDKDLTGSDGADLKLIRKMLTSQIKSVLNDRNLTLEEEERLSFHPLIFLSYKDGSTPMMSFGGFLEKKSKQFSLGKYGLDKYFFIREEADPFKIEPPLLTYKETHFINSHLPEDEDVFMSNDKLAFLSKDAKRNYRLLYKYLPNYMDVIS